MKTFLLKIIFFSALLLVIVGFMSVRLADSEEESFVRSIVAKHQRLDSFPSQRILLVGGSNVAYGFDSKAIQDSLQRPVVNLGLLRGLGLDFYLGELRHSIKQGDLVILSPEYFIGEGRANLYQTTAYYYPEAAKYVDRNFYSVLDGYFDCAIYRIRANKDYLVNVAKEKITKKKQPVSVYNINSFNQYGDVVAHIGKPSPPVLTGLEKMEYEYWDGINKINDFASYAASKGVKVCYTFPSYAASAYEVNKAVINQDAEDIRKDMKVTVIGSATDFVYPDEDYYDTIYHLKIAGREKRTQQLLALLSLHKDLLN
jgi:hypothetical protein